MLKKVIVLGNGIDWCEHITQDFKKYENYKVINSIYPTGKNTIIKKIIKIHFSIKINNFINLPLKKIWFRYFVKNICENKDEKFVMIIYDRNRLANNEQFLRFLRNYYKNCQFVYIFTNIVKISGAMENNFVEKLKQYYDLVYAFDPSDAPKYGFNYNPLLYSLTNIDKMDYKKEQVFYVGRSKDRYEMIIKVYEKLKKINIPNKFYIFGVDSDKQLHKDSIIYNKFIPYKECLNNIINSDCILDIIQGESEGFTIKVCEAIYYDKLLITTNKNIKNTPFYDERYIRIIDSEDDIDKSFFKYAGHVHYKKEGKYYFSVQSFLKKLENDLKNIS